LGKRPIEVALTRISTGEGRGKADVPHQGPINILNIYLLKYIFPMPVEINSGAK
jgi:hypothetical protein